MLLIDFSLVSWFLRSTHHERGFDLKQALVCACMQISAEVTVQRGPKYIYRVKSVAFVVLVFALAVL